LCCREQKACKSNEFIISVVHKIPYESICTEAKKWMKPLGTAAVDCKDWSVESISARVCPTPMDKSLSLPEYPKGTAVVTVDCRIGSKVPVGLEKVLKKGNVTFEACLSKHVPFKWKITHLF
jgi:hypothetical protein